MEKVLIEKRPVRDVLRGMKVNDVERFPITQRNSVRNSLPDIKIELKLKGVIAEFESHKEEDDTVWVVTRIA